VGANRLRSTTAAARAALADALRAASLRAASLLVVSLAGMQASQAHEIPSDVTVRMFLKPEGRQLEVLVRVPLEAMRDIEFPTFGPGYLEIDNAASALRDAALLWLANDIILYADGRRLPSPTLEAVRVSLPSDRSFADYAPAAAHLTAPPLPTSLQLPWQQAMLDARFVVPIGHAAGRFAVYPRLARLGLRVTTVVHLVTSSGTSRVLELDGDPGVVELDPSWRQSFVRFLGQGFRHILDGIDHLLFLLCLVVPIYRDWRGLGVTVTAFTIGHSVTLAGSAYDLAPDALWFPAFVETAIAASILVVALLNIAVAVGPGAFPWGQRTRLSRAQTPASPQTSPSSAQTPLSSPQTPAARATALARAVSWRSQAVIALGFGLVHGFGFSFALRHTLQLAGDHVPAALLSFNLGIELGQLLAVLLLIPACYFLFRWVVAPRFGTIVLSVIVAHTAWHWLLERFTVLSAYDFGL
jgi:hypothetical protein